MAVADGETDIYLDNFDCRSNDVEGEMCSTGCGEELLWDRDEGMVYCVNDWYHG